MKYSLLIIDPQNDFTSPEGTLFVPGADEDCRRLGKFITDNIQKIDNIHITLDSHPVHHIAHPCFWKDAAGNSPAPYTIITYQDLYTGKYSVSEPSLKTAAEEYLLALENRGRYNLTIWPFHCLTATWGFCVEDNVWKAVHEWELYADRNEVDFVKKASNPMTEHYSAIQAEVPDPSDPDTRTNFNLIDKLKQADQIIVAGEALSHCLANTIKDLVVYIPAYKITILTDCTSSVTGFEEEGQRFMAEMRNKGMIFTKSDELVLE